MAVHDFHSLAEHVGHRIACVGYGDPAQPANVAVECETCHVVLIDFEREDADGDAPTE